MLGAVSVMNDTRGRFELNDLPFNDDEIIMLVNLNIEFTERMFDCS